MCCAGRARESGRCPQGPPPRPAATPAEGPRPEPGPSPGPRLQARSLCFLEGGTPTTGTSQTLGGAPKIMFEAWQLQGWQSAPCALRGLLGPRPLRPRSPRCQEGTRPRGAAETGGQGPPPSGPLAPSLVGGPSPLPSPVLWLQVSGSQAPGHAGQGGPGESQQLAQSPGEGTWEGLGEGFRKWKGYWRHDPGQALRIQPEARGSHWMCDSLPTCTGLYFLPQRPPPSFLHASRALQGDRTTPLAPPLAWALSPRDTIRNSAYGGVPVTRKASAPLKGTECLGGRSASWAESTLGRVHQPASPVSYSAK